MNAQDQLARLRLGVNTIIPEDDLRAKLERSVRDGRPLSVKLGMDPTAPDLHLGHTVVLRKLRDFQRLGHEVVLIIGDFTASIGDPSGRSETRPPLTPAQIEQAASTYQAQCFQVLDPEHTRVVYNSEWLAPLGFAEVIQLTSKYTVARLLERDDFANRFAAGHAISVHELLYSFCQAYDSVHLRCDVELGGNDQLFNILMGRDLQREYGVEPQVAMIMPILIGRDGVKMSKSLGNYIGISEPAQSIFDKLMAISDAMMPDYFRLTTDLPAAAIAELLAGHPLEAKKRLAAEIVTIYHDAAAAAAARQRWETVFSQRETPADIPTALIPAAELDEHGRIWLPKLLCAAGLAQGTREARRFIEQGAVRVNGDKIDDTDAELALEGETILQIGRRRFARVERGD